MKNLLKPLVLAAVLSGFLAACGGGGEPASPATASAVSDTATLPWNASATVDVLGNDSASRGSLEIVAVTPPAHGSALISGGKIVYTPQAGYFGEDRVSYTARATEGGATASADLTLTVNAALQLKGRLGTQAMAGATVSIAIGDRSVVVGADATGAYSAAIGTARPAEMITITASGAGANSRVRLTSLAGDAATLASMAAEGGVLSAERVPAINVSPQSTALAALIVEAHGGKAPADMATLQSLMFGQPPQRVIDLATVIGLVADHGLALPDGVADTLALIKQPASPALLALLKVEAESLTWHEERYLAARAVIVSSAALSGAPALASLRAEDRAYVAAFRATNPWGGLFVSYRPDGTATVAAQSGVHTATWKIAGGVIRIALAQPLSTLWSDQNPYSFEVVNYRDDATGLEIRQFAGAVQFGMAVVTHTGTTVTLDGPDAGTTQAIADEGRVVSLTDPAMAASLTSAEFSTGTRWAGVIQDANFDSFVQAADTLEILGSGHARMQRTGASVDWSVSNGWLRLVQAGLDRRYLRLSRNALSGEERWLVADFEAGSITRASEVMIVKAAPHSFGAAVNLSRRWKNGIDDLGVLWQNYFLDIYGDGQATMVTAWIDGYQTARAASWSVDAEGVFHMTAFEFSGGGVDSTRTWILVARTATQLFVMEHLQYASGELSRLNVYTDVGPAVACTAPCGIQD